MSAKTTASLLDFMITHRITPHAARVLLHLQVEERALIGGLAFGLTPSGIGGTINRLAARKLVAREIDPVNAKRVHVRIEQEGKGLVKLMKKAAGI